MIDTTPTVRQLPELSDEQQGAVSSLIAGVRQGKATQTLGGYAGTGKTTCIRSLSSNLGGFAVCAPTGRAAAVLRRKGIGASTIHSLIYRPEKDCDCKEPCDCPIVGWVLRTFLEAEGIIVDEASMVAEAVYRDLLSFGVPCVFVGDHGQLPPVEAKRTGFNLMADPQYKLERIHRHAGEIPRFAQWLRNGRPAGEFRPRSDAVVILGGDDIEEDILLGADQIVCAKNRTRVGVNAWVRRHMGRVARIERGERVICLKNDRDADVQNGMIGTVATVIGNQIDIETDDGPRERLCVDLDQFGREQAPDWGVRGLHPFDYAYAITCHKSQGGEWPSVLVIEERCYAWDHRRWAYTAASRAQEKLWWKADRPVRKTTVQTGPWVARATNSPEGGVA